MRELTTALNQPVVVQINVAVNRYATGRVVGVNKNNVTTTLSDVKAKFYDGFVILTIPASYVTAENLPATLTVYTTFKDVERTIETIALSQTPAPLDVATQDELNTVLAAKQDKPPTKRGMLAIGTPTSFVAQAGAVSAWAERIPVKMPFKTKRWRLRVANWNINSNSAPAAHTTPYTISDIYYGTPGLTHAVTGRLTGSYAAAPVKILDGGSVPVDGTDWVSAWVTDPNLQFSEDFKMFGYALTAPASGSGVGLVQSHPGFRNSAAGAAASISVAAGTNYVGNTLALDKRIEYEVETNAPTIIFVGASGEQGFNNVAGQGGGFEPVYLHETPPGIYAQRTKSIVLNAGVPGGRQNPFRQASYRAWTRFDGIQADIAVIDLGGNSVLNQQSLASTYGELWDVVLRARVDYGIKRIWITTILPVGEANTGTAIELLRAEYNRVIRLNIYATDGVIDVDYILRDPAAPLNQSAGFVDTDKIHPTIPGYQRWGNAIPLLQ